MSVETDGDSFDTTDDGTGWLPSLIGLRADIANGDERALYMAWLFDVQCGVVDDDASEPARPAGLGRLSPALLEFVDIFGLDGAVNTRAGRAIVASTGGGRKTIDYRLKPIIDYFGDRVLTEIRTADVGDFIADLRKPRIAGRRKTPRVPVSSRARRRSFTMRRQHGAIDVLPVSTPRVARASRRRPGEA